MCTAALATAETTCSSWGSCYNGKQTKMCSSPNGQWFVTQTCTEPYISDGAAIPKSEDLCALNSYVSKYCYDATYDAAKCFHRQRIFTICWKPVTGALQQSFLSQLHDTYTRQTEWTSSKWRFTWWKLSV